jgi:hypothetical protein
VHEIELAYWWGVAVMAIIGACKLSPGTTGPESWGEAPAWYGRWAAVAVCLMVAVAAVGVALHGTMAVR